MLYGVDGGFKSRNRGIGDGSSNNLVIGILHSQWPRFVMKTLHKTRPAAAVVLLLALRQEGPEAIIEVFWGGGFPIK